MEEYVVRKLEEMKTRALAWDLDEYTLAFQEQLKKQRDEPKREKNQTKKDRKQTINDRVDETKPQGSWASRMKKIES